MKRNIIVGEKFYADIDVLASAAAYQELLNRIGRKSNSVLTGIWNKTIPRTVKSWKPDVEKKFKYSPRLCQFILVGVSDPGGVDEFVSLAEVVEVYDHHDRFKDHWKGKLQDLACLEPVGACATLIWEKYKSYQMENTITRLSANLLYTAIFASTLDFRSKGSTQRDLIAAEELTPLISMGKDWKSQYYSEVQQSVLDDLSSSILSETKILELFGKNFLFGQVELWNAEGALKTPKDRTILEYLAHLPKYNQAGQGWVLNVVSISEGVSYFYSNDPTLLSALQEITKGETAAEGCLIAPALWQRKDLLRHPLIRKRE